MKRREALLGLLALPVLSATDAHAQRPGRPLLIAMLITGTAGATEENRKSFRAGLSELGLHEGQHYHVEERFADGVVSRLPGLVDELVKRGPDVLLTSSSASTLAAHKATTTIPVVSALMGDAVGLGLIASQSRPGGNVTGIVITDAELSAKQLDLARELVPAASRVGVLLNSQNPGTDTQRKGAEAAAAARSLSLVVADAATPDMIEPAFRQLEQAGASVTFVIGDAVFFSERQRIAVAALSVRMPTMFIWRDHVQAGGLMSYGVDLNANYRRAATYVAKIAKGERAGDIPVEQPVRFELTINLKTARTLGLTVPPALLAQAAEVIE